MIQITEQEHELLLAAKAVADSWVAVEKGAPLLSSDDYARRIRQHTRAVHHYTKLKEAADA